MNAPLSPRFAPRRSAEGTTGGPNRGVGAGKPIRVLLVDPHPIYRHGIRAVLQAEPDIVVVGEADDPGGAPALVGASDATVVVCGLPESLHARTDLLRSLSATNPRVRVILLVWTINEDGLIRATQAGAADVIGKDSRPSELVASVRQVGAGRAPIEDRIEAWIESSEGCAPTSASRRRIGSANGAKTEFVPRLSYRELQVLTAIAAGQSNKEIARALGISDQTVKNHISSILRTLSVCDRTQAVLYGVREGWLDLEAEPGQELLPTGPRDRERGRRANSEPSARLIRSA